MKQRDVRKYPGSASRRDFLRSAGLVAGYHFLDPRTRAQGGTPGVAIVTDSGDPTLNEAPVKWAVEQLREALRAKGVSAEIHQELGRTPSGSEVILVSRTGSELSRPLLSAAGLSASQAPESVAMARGRAADRPALLVSGADARGLVYGLLEIADRISHSPDAAAALRNVPNSVETPANPVRSIARYFESDVEDKPWFYDKSFWRAYLSMLATHRFNRFSLSFGLGYNRPRDVHDAYFYFAYPFLFAVPGYKVRVPQLADEERDRNWAMLRWISEEATARGLDFQLALWTHAYQWIDSPRANYTIEGLTPQTHGPYCRDALRKLLEECPAIKGVTIRAHSESGIPEGSYDFWQTLFDGFKRAGRPVEIDIHSKGIEHKLLRMALDTGNPVKTSPKYWAEHMGLPYHQASIREMEKTPADREPGRIETERRFTRYGYADYLRHDRQYGVLYRIWPGTQRTLLWGDPAFAAGYGRYAHFCGSDGLELCEPLSFKGRMGSGVPGDRNAYADASLRPSGGDWRKFAYTYRLWGRLLYNPDASPECWRRQLRAEFGPAATDCEEALARASRVLPLVTVAYHPSASNNSYWPEIYTNMPIVPGSAPVPYRDTPSPRRFGTVSSLDPELFAGISEFADVLLDASPCWKYTPLDVARWLEADTRTAEQRLSQARAKVRDPKDPAFRRLAVDVSAQIGLGRFFAEKFRAGVAYELYDRTGERALLERAVRHYRRARDAWKKIIEATEGVYVADITYGRAPHLRGHWKDRLPAIEQDLAAMERSLENRVGAAGSGGKRSLPPGTDLDALFAASSAARPRCEHLPPAPFQPGKPLTIEMAVESGYGVSRVRLHYRHANQAENYQVAEMPVRDGRCRTEIPSAYTDSPFPLVYFFEVRDHHGRAWIYPGFAAGLANQPYYVVQQA